MRILFFIFKDVSHCDLATNLYSIHLVKSTANQQQWNVQYDQGSDGCYHQPILPQLQMKIMEHRTKVNGVGRYKNARAKTSKKVAFENRFRRRRFVIHLKLQNEKINLYIVQKYCISYISYCTAYCLRRM